MNIEDMATFEIVAELQNRLEQTNGIEFCSREAVQNLMDAFIHAIQRVQTPRQD